MIPKNEQGVIVAFAQECEKYGFEILEIQSEFPDAIIEKDGKQYAVEFEFCSSNFIKHGHDDAGCDLIICWEDDAKLLPLPVLPLSDQEWHKRSLIPDLKKAIRFWRTTALVAQRQVNGLQEKIRELESQKYEGYSGTPYECEICGETTGKNGVSFRTQEALNAHKRWCEKVTA